MASLLCFAVFGLCACGDDPQPAPVDARVGYPDISAVPIDGMTVTDVPATDIVDERGLTCRGGFRPCECSPGETGRDYCVNMAFEGVCRCGDAAPPSTDATADAARDGAASDGAAGDGAASDGAAGDDASSDGGADAAIDTPAG